MAADPLIQLPISTKGEGHSPGQAFLSQVLVLLKKLRGINVTLLEAEDGSKISLSASSPIADMLSALSSALTKRSKKAEAATIEHVVEKVVDKKNFGGLGLREGVPATAADYEDVLFLMEAWLEALNSQERASSRPAALETRSPQTRPMTLAEKIFAHHTTGGCSTEGVAVGDLVRVSVDWIMASELSWSVRPSRSSLDLLRFHKVV